MMFLPYLLRKTRLQGTQRLPTCSHTRRQAVDPSKHQRIRRRAFKEDIQKRWRQHVEATA